MVKKTKKVSEDTSCSGWTKRTKNMTYHDMKHMKLASIAFAFFLISVWSGLANWVINVHWAWFLGAMILLSIKPWTSFWGKRCE